MTIVKKKTHISSKINKILNGLKNNINTSVEKAQRERALERVIDDTWAVIWQKIHGILLHEI